MVVVVTLAILREGSEIMQFGGGILGQGQAGLPIFYGGVVGAGIGVSTGVLLYYALTGLSIENSLKACVLLLTHCWQYGLASYLASKSGGLATFYAYSVGLKWSTK